MLPHYCLPLLPHRRCHSAAVPHCFRTATAAACTLMASHCCCLAAATLLSSPPILQQSKTKQTIKPYPTCKLPPPSPPPQPPPPSPSPPQPHPSPRSPRPSNVHRPHRKRHRLHRFRLASRHTSYPTACHIIYVTTLPHRGRVGPPGRLRGAATTSNTRHNSKRNETPQPTCNYSLNYSSITTRCGSDKGGASL